MLEELVKWSAAFRFTLRIKVALFHCVVTPVSAIVRKLEMVFGSNESAYLRCLCLARAVRTVTAFVSVYNTAARRFVFECRVASVVKQITCGSPSVLCAIFIVRVRYWTLH